MQCTVEIRQVAVRRVPLAIQRCEPHNRAGVSTSLWSSEQQANAWQAHLPPATVQMQANAPNTVLVHTCSAVSTDLPRFGNMIARHRALHRVPTTVLGRVLRSVRSSFRCGSRIRSDDRSFDTDLCMVLAPRPVVRHGQIVPDGSRVLVVPAELRGKQ
jgi:hypothetical protein